jgi:hypothetical protein
MFLSIFIAEDNSPKRLSVKKSLNFGHFKLKNTFCGDND